VTELFLGVSNGFPGANDPCNDTANRTAEIEAFCVAQGVPVDSLDGFQQANAQIEGIFSGNPNLGEEKSETWSVGGVYQPSDIPGLSVTIDYYSIALEDAIASRGGGMQGTLDACFVLLDPNSEFCSAITRRAGGQIDTVDLTNANVSQITTRGIDVQIDYTIDMQEAFDTPGTLDLFWLGTHVFTHDTAPNPLVPSTECAGFFGPGCNATIGGAGIPDDSFTSRATYSVDNYSVSMRWRWIGSLRDRAGGVVDPVGSEHYVDLSFVWNANETYRFTAGVDNIFNNNAPVIGTSQTQSNTLPSLYDVLGTRLFASVTANF